MSAATFSLNLGADAKPAPVRIEQLVIAGWTGRDKRAVEVDEAAYTPPTSAMSDQTSVQPQDRPTLFSCTAT